MQCACLFRVFDYVFNLPLRFLHYNSSIAWTFVQDMKYLDLESTRILKVDEIYPYSLQCDACQQIFIREPAAISIPNISSTIKNRNLSNQNFFS